MHLVFLISVKLLSGGSVGYCQRPFQHLMKMIMCLFLSQVVSMVDYVDGFSYVEPSLHSWDEAYLIVVNDSFEEYTR